MTNKDKTIALHGSVWMTVDGENFGGKGRIALLAQIAACGSITQAAKAMKMSYKAAWDAIDSMNNLAGEPLTPKQIADRMELSPSSVQHHLQKLLALGLVELHHTETIHGITARYYRVAAKTVRIGSLTENTLLPQRLALLQSLLSTVFLINCWVMVDPP